MISAATQREVQRSVLFSVTDRQMESFLTERNFERSLVLGVLFQPNVFMPDIFFFISEPLYMHVHGRRRMLFEQAVHDGLIIPSFRERSTSSFHEALQVVERAGIGGLLPLEKRLEIADRLDEVTRTGLKYTNWPTQSVAGRYRTLMIRVMTGDEPPLTGYETDAQVEEVTRTWDHSHRWRIDSLDKAITEHSTELRRGTYMAEIAKSVGLAQPPDDLRAIFGAAQEVGYNREEVAALRNICLLMNDCYLYNMAAEHGCYPDFPKHDAWSAALINVLAEPSSTAAGENTRPTLLLDLEIPPIEALLEMSAYTLMRIREEYGLAYLTAVRAWQRNPNDGNANEVRERLLEYVKIIRVQFARVGSGWQDHLIVAHESTSQLGWRVARLGMNAIGGGIAAGGSIATAVDPQSPLGSILALGAIPAALVAVYETGTTIVGIRRSAELRKLTERRARETEETVVLYSNQELSIPLSETAAAASSGDIDAEV
jgi:hypothetical protein